MKAAVLILGHSYPEVLRLAQPIYEAAGFDVFVHVDLKLDMDDYKSRCQAPADWRFIDNRVRIFRCGFSMIEAELALIRAAMDEGPYDRFILLSDDTFPILPPVEIRDLVFDDWDRISMRKLSTNEAFYMRYDRFFYLDHAATSRRMADVESAAIDEYFLREMNLLGELMSTGKKRLDVFYGSQWWILRNATIFAILEACKEQQLVMSFRYSAVPDEMFFQTIFANYVNKRAKAGPVFVEWGKSPRPYVFKSEAEFAARATRDHLFVRKVAPEASPFIGDLARRLLS